MSRLGEELNRLDGALVRVRCQWDSARQLWRDSVQESFEKEHWEPLEGSAQAVIESLRNLDQLVADIERRID